MNRNNTKCISFLISTSDANQLSWTVIYVIAVSIIFFYSLFKVDIEYELFTGYSLLVTFYS